jgi:hypothetical protein
LAWFAAKYPTRANDLRAAFDAAITAVDARNAPLAAFYAANSASRAAPDRAADATARAVVAAATFARYAGTNRALAQGDPDVHEAGNAASDRAGAAAWTAVNVDIKGIQSQGVGVISDMPLWPFNAPDWARAAWADFKASRLGKQDWDVWIDWYDQRLLGGSRGEAYELPFATVPRAECDRGPAAVNAWIKAHLPKAPEAVQTAKLPSPLSGLDAPFAYGWTASQRVAVVAGAQNLPDYRHFSSEEDHRQALEACRKGGERLLKTLRDGRYNARPEYAEALEYYLADLPKTAGAGNILLANDQVRILHAMFLADAAALSEGFASRLRSVITNQFALNAFYDLVQRHNEAVGAGNWTRPFPLDAAKGFFGAVEDNTPRWFEPQIEKGLPQVENAEPPPAAASEPTPESAIEPPPLPPGTPDAQDSWKRQMATAANALWETFRQGENMPVDKDEWRKAAEELGAHVRPIIDFLREQEAGKK